MSEKSEIKSAKDRTALSREIGAKATRKLRAQRHVTRTVWFGLGMMGLIGWSVAIPTLLGALLGLWLDQRYPAGRSWTLALLVAGLGIMNVMLIRVMQRRREIGIRRAVGASTRSIVVQFLLESVAQSLVGAALGSALGFAGVLIYCTYAEWRPYVSPLTVATAILFGLGTGALFGAYPALRAARLDPILALRDEA